MLAAVAVSRPVSNGTWLSPAPGGSELVGYVFPVLSGDESAPSQSQDERTKLVQKRVIGSNELSNIAGTLHEVVRPRDTPCLVSSKAGDGITFLTQTPHQHHGIFQCLIGTLGKSIDHRVS